jgi:hypothetical protein
MAAMAAATIAMFQPEIATTWLTPAVVNAAARSRSTRSRRPIRMPAAGSAPQSLQSTTEIVGCWFDHERPGRQRADRPDPLEVLPVCRVGTFPDRPVDHDRVARDHDGISGKRCRDPDHGTFARGAERRGLLAVARRTDRFDDHLPRAATVGRRLERGRGRRHDREAHGDGRGTERDGEQRSQPEARSNLAHEQDRGETQGDSGPEMTRRDLPSGHRRDDRPDRQAAAPTHVRTPLRDP